MANFRTFSIGLFVLGALVGSAGCSEKVAVDARLLPPLVRVTSIDESPAVVRSFTGVISARVQSDLGFRVPGKITQRLVDTGQLVKLGQPLMRLDPTDYALGIVAQTGAVDAARARAIQTSADEGRYRDLVAAGAVSALTYDQAKSAADAAKAQLSAAEAQLKVSKDAAGYAVLVADSDGIVVQTLAESGQVVSAGQTVVRLAHDGPREATVNLPETLRPALGSTARATVFGTNALATAKLRQLSHAADPTTRTFEARYVLDQSQGEVPLGATVTIHIPESLNAQGMRVPLSALYDNGNGPGVWLIDKTASTVSWRAITLAGLGDETATVTGGLKPNDVFVSLGAHQLHQGEKVRLEKTLVSAR